MVETILVVHSGKELMPALKSALDKRLWKLVSTSPEKTLTKCAHASAACVMMILDKGEMTSGEQLLADLRRFDENLPVIFVASVVSPEGVVRVMKAGAFDFFVLPVEAEKLNHAVANAVRLYDLTKRVYLLERQMQTEEGFEGMLGVSQAMRDVFMLVRTVSKSRATVLIQGASGTGKELIAKAIHRLGDRNKKPFIDINCGAIPHELLENEMFGHERGAYTGADKRYIGSVERAHGGTLFLDEISEMDQALQVKLLRFLQERTFMRVGGNEQITVDVRIVAATNKNLQEEAEAGRFREDLYYRLNVVPIFLPTLARRREDIPLLAKYFLQKYAEKNSKIFLEITPDVIEKLINYPWPGNVRELENTIERVVVLHNDRVVKPSHLPEHIRTAKATGESVLSSVALCDNEKILPLDVVERYAIEVALKKCMGNVFEAAKHLRIGQATLYRKIKQYGLRV